MATEEEMSKAVTQYLTDMAEGRCPVCHEPVQEERQVGRCVYALPCWHRMFQGKAKTKEKTWKDHPYFQDQQKEQP